MKKTLVTDVVFPTKLSLWRICEIASFIKEKNADIMVFKIDDFAGITYSIDFEEMKNILGYEEYNILIFDQKYNHLNEYNTKVDGTKWNGKFPASYVFTKNSSFDINEYDLIYHIFLHCYREFNQLIEYPREKQAIHLYPGGGFSGVKSLQHDLLHSVRLISTNPKTSSLLESEGITDYLECLGGTFFTKTDIYPYKKLAKHDGQLTIAFASLGHSIEKGASIYHKIANEFSKKHPSNSVNFIAIGNYPFAGENVTVYPAMSMMELMDFYYRHVDILVSIDTGVAFNGWPLGIEAALTGVLLATTDPNKIHHHYDIPSRSLVIFDPLNMSDILDLMKTMDEDREKLFRWGERCRKYFSSMCSYTNQQEKIFSFIDI